MMRMPLPTAFAVLAVLATMLPMSTAVRPSLHGLAGTAGARHLLRGLRESTLTPSDRCKYTVSGCKCSSPCGNPTGDMSAPWCITEQLCDEQGDSWGFCDWSCGPEGEAAVSHAFLDDLAAQQLQQGQGQAARLGLGDMDYYYGGEEPASAQLTAATTAGSSSASNAVASK